MTQAGETDNYKAIDHLKAICKHADDNGNKYKEVQCKSREYGLIGKKLTDYKADSRVLYDPSDTMLDGLEKVY